MKMLPSSLSTLSSMLAALSDSELLAEVERMAGDERTTTRLIASLAEVDKRRLYRDAGCSSLFTYCTEVLKLSEHASYLRMEAARAAGRFPLILDRLAEGTITLTAVSMLAKHLTEENHRALLDEARHQSKRELEKLVARMHPRPDAAAIVRRLPSPRQPAQPTPPSVRNDRAEIGRSGEGPLLAVGGDTHADAPASGEGNPRAGQSLEREEAATPPRSRAVISPLAPERYKVQVTIGAGTHAKLRRVQDLLRHVIPDGDPAAILDRALTLLLADLEKTRLAATTRPRPPHSNPPASRHIPAAVRRAVWARDEGRCAFVGSHGRCTERGLLEFHHRVPYAAGGAATIENIEVRCRSHNALEADRHFRPHVEDGAESADSEGFDSCGLNQVRTEFGCRAGERSENYGIAKEQLFDYIEVSHNQRRHSTLGQISPAAFERRAAA